MNKLNVVLKVERTECRNLSGMVRTGKNTVKIPNRIDWKEIKIRQLAQLQISEKSDAKVHLYTATLKFYTCQDINDRGNYAYRLSIIGGDYRLIGTAERPYPVLSVNETTPEKVSDNQWNEVTVTWTSPWQIPLIEG